MENERKIEKILFVCLGNICRSPAADEVMRCLVADDVILRDRIVVDSAGIGDWHVGQLPDRRMRECGRKRGYDFSHRARQVLIDDFDDFDLVIGMDKGNLSDLNALAHTDNQRKKIRSLADYMMCHPDYTTIPDPYYGGEEDFEIALDLIEDGCRGLLETLHTECGK